MLPQLQTSRSGFTVVEVNVVNENDHSPEFSQNLYTASIMENVATNSFVVFVSLAHSITIM